MSDRRKNTKKRKLYLAGYLCLCLSIILLAYFQLSRMARDYNTRHLELITGLYAEKMNDSMEYLLNYAQDNVKVAQAMVNRVSGFLEYWAKYAPEKWTINQDIRLNGGDMENAQTDVAALLSNNRQIKGLYGCNNTSTKGIAAVLMKTNRQDIVMAGFDLAKETASLIRNPDYHGITLLQKQDQMAYEGMLSLDRQIRGETSEQKYIDTGVLLVDRDYLLENEPNE